MAFYDCRVKMPDATASEGASEQRQVATQVAKSPKSHPQAATPTQHLSKSPSRGKICTVLIWN